jgi:hypothetical protein
VALLLQSSSLHSTSRSSCRHHHSPSSQRDARGHGSRRKIQELQILNPTHVGRRPAASPLSRTRSSPALPYLSSSPPASWLLPTRCSTVRWKMSYQDGAARTPATPKHRPAQAPCLCSSELVVTYKRRRTATRGARSDPGAVSIPFSVILLGHPAMWFSGATSRQRFRFHARRFALCS